jgi:hypothetical protein
MAFGLNRDDARFLLLIAARSGQGWKCVLAEQTGY